MFRFTIRELVLVTVIVALAVGWWLDHRDLTLRCRVYARQEDYERRRFQGMVFFVDDLMKGFEAVHPGWRKDPYFVDWMELEGIRELAAQQMRKREAAEAARRNTD